MGPHIKLIVHHPAETDPGNVLSDLMPIGGIGFHEGVKYLVEHSSSFFLAQIVLHADIREHFAPIIVIQFLNFIHDLLKFFV